MNNQLTDEDLAAINAAAGADPLLEARAEVDGLCSQFAKLARMLQDAERALSVAMVGEQAETNKDEVARLRASRERIMSAAFIASDAVHAAQRRWMLQGIDVFVAHTRNGSPIRVDKVTRDGIIGY